MPRRCLGRRRRPRRTRRVILVPAPVSHDERAGSQHPVAEPVARRRVRGGRHERSHRAHCRVRCTGLVEVSAPVRQRRRHPVARRRWTTAVRSADPAYGYGILDAGRAVRADVPSDRPNPVYAAVDTVPRAAARARAAGRRAGAAGVAGPRDRPEGTPSTRRRAERTSSVGDRMAIAGRIAPGLCRRRPRACSSSPHFRPAREISPAARVCRGVGETAVREQVSADELFARHYPALVRLAAQLVDDQRQRGGRRAGRLRGTRSAASSWRCADVPAHGRRQPGAIGVAPAQGRAAVRPARDPPGTRRAGRRTRRSAMRNARACSPRSTRLPRRQRESRRPALLRRTAGRARSPTCSASRPAPYRPRSAAPATRSPLHWRTTMTPDLDDRIRTALRERGAAVTPRTDRTAQRAHPASLGGADARRGRRGRPGGRRRRRGIRAPQVRLRPGTRRAARTARRTRATSGA